MRLGNRKRGSGGGGGGPGSDTTAIHTDGVSEYVNAAGGPGAASGYRILTENNSTGVKFYSSFATLDNLSGLTNALTAIGTLATDDVVRVEDVSASNAGRKATIAEILALRGGIPPLVADPASPSSFDDRFSAGSLDAKWTPNTAFSGSAIDPYATIATNPRVAYGTIIPGYLSVQPIDNTNFILSQAITLAADCSVYFECAWSDNNVAWSGTNYGQIGLGLATDAAATENVFVYPLVNVTGSNFLGAAFDHQDSGGYGRVGEVSSGSTTLRTMQWCAGRIQKRTNTYDAYVYDRAGNRTHLGSVAFTGGATLDTLLLACKCDGGVPGTRIFHFGDVRYQTGIASW